MALHYIYNTKHLIFFFCGLISVTLFIFMCIFMHVCTHWNFVNILNIYFFRNLALAVSMKYDTRDNNILHLWKGNIYPKMLEMKWNVWNVSKISKSLMEHAWYLTHWWSDFNFANCPPPPADHTILPVLLKMHTFIWTDKINNLEYM
jgi:hypothetical protein